MTQPPSGWYGDPSNPAQYRYWDGAQWTDHTAPPPTSAPAPAGNPAQAYPGAQAHPGAQPYVGGQAYAGGPGYTTAPAFGPTTPDGIPLASYWSRVGALMLDSLITSAAGMILGWPFLSKLAAWYSDVLQGAMNGLAMPDSAEIAAQTFGFVWPYTLIGLAIHLAYHLFFLTRFGATPGKMACHLSVRLRERPGPLSLAVAGKRVALQAALSALGLIRPLATLLGFIVLADDLWPAWDAKRQALHDKIAGTNVVQVPRNPTGGR